MKTAQINNNRIVGISSDDFFHINTKDNKLKNQKSQKDNKKTKKNLSIEKSKKVINKKESNKPKPKTNSKSIKLPDEFFEQILEYELQLKLKFDPKIFFELINLYSSAIKFYEAMKNDKFMTYNLGLNMLFSMPEVKGFMEGEKNLTKNEKKEAMEKKFEQSEQKITNEKVKSMYKSRMNKNKKGLNLMKDDFDKQTVSFKKRLQEKKKKYISSMTLAPADTEKENKSFKFNSRNNNNNKNNSDKLRNRSVDIIKQKSIFNNEEEYLNEEETNFNKFMMKKSVQLNMNYSIDKNNFFDETEKDEIKNDINKLSSFSGSGTDSEKDTTSFTANENIILDGAKMHKITNRTLFKEKMKINFDVYICQYYNKFIENTMNSIVDDYVKCGNEFEKKLYDNTIDYFKQKKEMESLIKVQDEDNNDYNEQINKALEEVKEEEQDKKNKIINEAINRVDKLNDKYFDIDKLNNKHNINMIKEKLKLDVIKSLNSFVLK
jgi:hypothetical protein